MLSCKLLHFLTPIHELSQRINPGHLQFVDLERKLSFSVRLIAELHDPPVKRQDHLLQDFAIVLLFVQLLSL